MYDTIINGDMTIHGCVFINISYVKPIDDN